MGRLQLMIVKSPPQPHRLPRRARVVPIEAPFERVRAVHSPPARTSRAFRHEWRAERPGPFSDGHPGTVGSGPGSVGWSARPAAREARAWPDAPARARNPPATPFDRRSLSNDPPVTV